MTTRTILKRVSMTLAENEIWMDPTEIVLVHHPKYGFNRHTVEDVIEVIAAEEDDVDILNNGYSDDNGPVDPGDLCGDSFCITAQNARALGEALIRAAQGIEARRAETAQAGSVADESPTPQGMRPTTDCGEPSS